MIKCCTPSDGNGRLLTLKLEAVLLVIRCSKAYGVKGRFPRVRIYEKGV